MKSVHVTRSTMVLKTAIWRYEAQMRADGKAPLTQAAYLRDLGPLERSLGPRTPVGAITPHRLAQFLISAAFTQTAAGVPKAVTSLNRSKSAIRTFFQFLVDAGHLKGNPARLVRLGRAPQKPPRPLSPADMKCLLATLRKHRNPLARRDETMFRLMLGTGIRLGSLVNLNVPDVDLAHGTIRVNGKGNVEQLVFVSSRLARALRSHIADRRALDVALFLSSRGGRIGPRQVEMRFAHWLTVASIEHRYSVHALRHTFATRLYERTGDLRLVQRALGHRRVSTTEIYTRISDSRVRRAVRAMENG